MYTYTFTHSRTHTHYASIKKRKALAVPSSWLSQRVRPRWGQS